MKCQVEILWRAPTILPLKGFRLENAMGVSIKIAPAEPAGGQVGILRQD
jgi:hypothetical protein